MAEKTLDEQITEVNAKLRDPKITYREKDALINQSLRLNRQKSRETV